MTPTAAWESPVFRFYAAVIVGLMVFGGLVIGVLRFGLKKNVDHAWNSFRGWLLMVPLVLVSMYLGRAAAIVFFTVVALIGFKEFARATGLYRDWWMTGIVHSGI